MEMPLNDDFKFDDFVSIDFNEADFADVNNQGFVSDAHGFANNEEPSRQFSPLPAQQEELPAVNSLAAEQGDDDAAFIAEVMAGVQMEGDGNVLGELADFRVASVNYGGEQSLELWEGDFLSNSDYEMPPLASFTMPMGVNWTGEGGMEAPEAVTAFVDKQLPPFEQSGDLMNDGETSMDTNEEAHTIQEGCIAPPSSPAAVIQALPVLSMRAVAVYHNPLIPASSPSPAKRSEPDYQRAAIPISSIEVPAVYHQNTAQGQMKQAPQINMSHQTALGTNYQHRFQDFDAARQALVDPDSDERLVKLPVTVQDDWDVVKTERLHTYAAQLYDAIQAEPGESPRNFTEPQRAYYYKQQAKVLNNIKEQIASKPAAAEARALLLFEEIIDLHEKGLPEAILDRGASGSNFAVETSFTCSARAEKIIEIAGSDKYVAFDILNGTNLKDLTRSPIKYLERKRQNSKVNAKKAENNRLAAHCHAVPVASPGPGVKVAAKNELATRRMLAGGSDATFSQAVPANPAQVARPRTGTASRVKATLKRKFVGEVLRAPTTRAERQDGDQDMADV